MLLAKFDFLMENRESQAIGISWQASLDCVGFLMSLLPVLRSLACKNRSPKQSTTIFHLQTEKQQKSRSSVKRKQNKSTTKTSQSKDTIFLKSCFDEHLIFSQKRFQWKCWTNHTEKPLHKEMFQFPLRWQLQNKGHKKSYVVTTYHSWLTI